MDTEKEREKAKETGKEKGKKKEKRQGQPSPPASLACVPSVRRPACFTREHAPDASPELESRPAIRAATPGTPGRIRLRERPRPSRFAPLRHGGAKSLTLAVAVPFSPNLLARGRFTRGKGIPKISIRMGPGVSRLSEESGSMVRK